MPDGKTPGKNLFKEKFETVFGPLAGHPHAFAGVLNFRTFLPVVIATLLIAGGWIFVMLTVGGSSLLSPSQVSAAQPADVTDSLNPARVRLESFQFGFLGAYFFILQSLVRRYFQRDLKADAYVNATTRIIIVALLVWVVTYSAFAMASGDLPNTGSEPALLAAGARRYLPVLAFVIGVFPVVGWRIVEAGVKRVFRWAVPTLHEHFPLHRLEGLNVWYEFRLMEEGIENMENLATVNLVDAMLNTRVPVNRLVDWVDQSLLHLHLGEGSKALGKLRSLGVRTATDICDLKERSRRSRALARALNEGREDIGKTVECLYATLRDEPNFFHVQEWRRFPRTKLEEEAKRKRAASQDTGGPPLP